MKLNCKPGDLAVLVRSVCGNEGKLCRCERFLGKVLFRWLDGTLSVMPAWKVDRAFLVSSGRMNDVVPDCFLRPIRPSDDPDETLTWAGLPADQKRGVPA